MWPSNEEIEAGRNKPNNRYYWESRNGIICVIDRNTDKIKCNCSTVGEAKAHCRGLNK